MLSHVVVKYEATVYLLCGILSNYFHLINLNLLVTFMNMIKIILLIFSMVFLFVSPKASNASIHLQDIITNQTLDDVSQKNLNNILAHKEAKAHSHPHNIMMGKQIKKEIKRDESVIKINIKETRSLPSEAKKRYQQNQEDDVILDDNKLQIFQQDIFGGVKNIYAPSNAP